MPAVLALLLFVGSSASAQDDALRATTQRLRALASRPNLGPENLFLHDQVAILVERSRRAPAGSFFAERLELATKDLLDASERIVEARNGRPTVDRSEETRRLMARDLERTYFRIQEGGYFARQFQAASGDQYVLSARRLYQLARAAYDDREYTRVGLFAEAARGVVTALERLAQAEVGVPDPPRLPEG